jgi:acyl dehydratase
MSDDTLITPEIREMLGREEYFPGKEMVDISSIRRYAQAIFDPSCLYLGEGEAQESEYGDVIAPPTFLLDVSQNIFSEIGPDGRDLSRISIPGLNAIRGGNEYIFLEPVKPGDLINRRRKIIDVYEKTGKKAGNILFIVSETIFTNQEGKTLAKCRETMMFLK